jgi:chemotaxis protein histidine kinase CheA
MKILEEAKKAEEAAMKAAEDARKQSEAEAKRAAEEAKKQKAAEEAKKKAEAEAKAKAEAEAKAKAEAEAKAKAEEELRKKAEEEARLKLETETKKAEEEARKKAEEARKILEEAKKAEEQALKAAQDAENIKLDLTKPVEDGKLPMAAYYLDKYTRVDGLSGDVIKTFNSIAADKLIRNVVILGEHGFGLTFMGEDFARSFYDMGIVRNKTMAKIKGTALNKVKLADAMSKLAGGCLVVENAGVIIPDKFKELTELSSEKVNDVVIILTGEEGSIDRLFGTVPELKSKYANQIVVGKLTSENMVSIAKGHIENRGYKSDETVDSKIKNMLMAMESGNVDRMLKAVDDALLACDEREKGSNRKNLLAEDFK